MMAPIPYMHSERSFVCILLACAVAQRVCRTLLAISSPILKPLTIRSCSCFTMSAWCWDRLSNIHFLERMVPPINWFWSRPNIAYRVGSLSMPGGDTTCSLRMVRTAGMGATVTRWEEEVPVAMVDEGVVAVETTRTLTPSSCRRSSSPPETVHEDCT